MFLTTLLALSSTDALAARHPSQRGTDKASQKSEAKALTFSIEKEIDVSADALWEIVGTQYVDVSTWAALVPESREATPEEIPADWATDADAPVEARTCVTGFGQLTEVLIDYDDAGRTFTFRPAGLPKMIVYSQNHTVIESTGESSSKIVMSIHMEPKGMARLMKGKMQKQFTEGLTGFLNDLEHYAENGEPSPAKVAAAAAEG